MELRHLRTFLAVAEELHFSRAAARMHVAQPALSRTIADLEEEMAVLLVERNSRAVALTEAGTLFLERVRQILVDTDDAVEAAQRRARGETGTLRIGFIGTLSQDLLPRLLHFYRERFPAVDLVLRELGPSQQRQEIIAGKLDCGFLGMTLSNRDAELEMVTVAEESLVAALPESHGLALRKVLRLADLRHESFYLTARSNAPIFNPWLIQLCRDAKFEPCVTQEIDRAATVLNYVAAGFGISVFPAQIAKLATTGVRFVPLSGKLQRYPYKLAWARGRETQTVKEFVKVAKHVD
ncbi:MAG: LysR family transcriptional regulator [Verrucomicrobia bacterium]|nr:MAG: LysR family transcriptional regulator [Verrucomicrobiota bacterium]